VEPNVPNPPETVGPDSAPHRADDLATVEVDGETVVYDERNGALHVLNPTATIVWQCLDGDVSLRELASELAAASGADGAQVEADVLDAVRTFARSGLLRTGSRVDPADGGERDGAPGVDPRPVRVPGST
jgi:PqqD family protein of HPr-rel-A system